MLSFTPFSNRLAPPTDDPKAFTTPQHQSTQGKNLWEVIDSVVFPNEKKAERRERFHLYHDLTLFSRFFRQTYTELNTNQTCQTLLREGMQNLSRKASLLYERGMLNEKELTTLQKELQIVEQTLMQTPQEKDKKNPWHQSFIKPFSTRFDYKTSDLSPISPMSVQQFTRPPKNNGASLPSIPPFPEPLSTDSLPSNDLSSNSPLEALKKISSFISEWSTLLQEQQYSLLKKRIEETLLTFPFPADPSIFASLSPQETQQACEEIHRITQLLCQACRNSQTTLPKHVLLITTLTLLQQKIALVHPEQSLLASTFRCRYIERVATAFDDKRLLHHLDEQKPYSYTPLIQTINAWTKIPDNALSKGHSQNDILALYKKNKKNPLLTTLAAELRCIDELIPIIKEKSRSYYREKIFESPLRPFTWTALRAALSHADVSKGGYQNDLEKLSLEKKLESDVFNIPVEMTPESIVDDPFYIATQLNKQIKEPLVFEQSTNPGLSKEDLRDIFFLFTEKMPIQQMMSLLQEKPHLLDSPDVRALCYHIPFDCPFDRGLRHYFSYSHSTKNSSLSFTKNFSNNFIPQKWRSSSSFDVEHQWNPSILDHFPEWIRKQVAFNSSQGNIERALFLIEFNHRWIRECRKQSTELGQKGVDNAPDYLPLLEEWARQSLLPHHPLTPHKNAIWKELLHHYIDKTTLTSSEAELITIARFVLRGTRLIDKTRLPNEKKRFNTSSINGVTRFKNNVLHPLIFAMPY